MAMDEYAAKLSLQGARVLDVGIAGDPRHPDATSPSEKYAWFGAGNHFATLDVDPAWKPDYVGDITNPPFEDNSWDLVILTSTLEHIYDFRAALRGVHRITSKYAIVDCPFSYPYHPTLPSFDDYWRMSAAAMRKLLDEIGFSEAAVELRAGILTTALVTK